MKRQTELLLSVMFVVGITTLMSSWYFFLGYGIWTLIYCIIEESKQ